MKLEVVVAWLRSPDCLRCLISPSVAAYQVWLVLLVVELGE